MSAPFLWLAAGLRFFSFKSQSWEGVDHDKLQDLIAHVENYIDLAIGRKFDDKTFTATDNENMKIFIATTVQDALAKHNFQLSTHDFNAIKDNIEKDLSDREQAILNRLMLTNNDHLLILQTQITQNIEAKVSEVKGSTKNFDISEVLSAMLKSHELTLFISEQLRPLSDRLDRHDSDIVSLKLDLDSFKAEVKSKFVEINNDITIVKGDIGEGFYKLKIDVDKRLKDLLSDIDIKLASLGDFHFTSVEESVKKSLFAILGLNAASGMDGEAIKNWIGSIFVAKSELEERLKLFEADNQKAFELRLDANAGILMNEINEEIRKQIAVSAGLSGNVGGLSEADVLKIVKQVLAVYDADKTGLVDFALESAGGQVLSTR